MRSDLLMKVGGVVILVGGLSACNSIKGELCQDIQNQLTQAERNVKEKQSEVDKLNQELQTLKTQVSSQRGQIEDKQSQLAQRNADLKVLSTCLQGVVTAISQNNQAAALLELSAVARECKQADGIVENLNSNNSGGAGSTGSTINF
jgi:septal ring factor EnvC (AmiA/AmiB activator)